MATQNQIRDNASAFRDQYINPERRSNVQNIRTDRSNSNRSDPSEGRRNRTPVRNNQGRPGNSTVAPQNETRDQAFNRQYQNPEERFGVQNSRSTVRGDQTLTSRPSEDGRRKRTAPIYQGRNESQTEESIQNQKVAARYIDEGLQNQTPANPFLKAQVSQTVTSLAIKNTATTWMIITNSWSFTIWGFVQFWAGMMSSLFFGLTAAVAYTYIGTVISTVATWFGYTQPNLMALGFWGLVTAALIGWFSMIIAAMHAKFWKLHPLLGRGGAVKTGAFLLAAVLYAMPLTNMLPWIMLWAWAVKAYPK